MLDGFVRRGYAVAQTDYEGNGTPGVHPYFVASPTARDVTDIVRASRQIDPQIAPDWIVMGHSEGGFAALATAALNSRFAPELHLVGAVAFAPASSMAGFLLGELHSDAPNGGLVFLALVMQGFSAADSRVDLSEMLEPEAIRMLPELQQRCVGELMRDSGWSRIVPRSIFPPSGQAAVQALYGDLLANDPNAFSITVPVLPVQGNSDSLIDPLSTLSLHDRLCRRGPVSIKAYGATHGTILAAASDDVAAWIAQRFAGVQPSEGCRS